MAEPQRGVAYEFPIEVQAVAASNIFLIDPPVVAGDFKVSKDFGALANLDTLPSVPISGTTTIQVSLSAEEMDADKIEVKAVDQDSAWKAVSMFIDVPAANSDNVMDLLEGDHIETRDSLIINKKGTSTELLNKTVGGSLLSGGVTITTTE